MVSSALNLVGLVANIYAAYLLSKNLFISDEEIDELSKLPIEQSSTHMSTGDGVSKPVALIPPTVLNDYRKNIIKRRKFDRVEGKKGFKILMVGFTLQVIALFF